MIWFLRSAQLAGADRSVPDPGTSTRAVSFTSKTNDGAFALTARTPFGDSGDEGATPTLKDHITSLARGYPLTVTTQIRAGAGI